MTASTALTLLIAVTAGAALGAAHLLTLAASVRRIAGGEVWAPVLLQVGRHLVVAAALFGAVWLGGGPGLIAFAAGLLGARKLLMPRVAGTKPAGAMDEAEGAKQAARATQATAATQSTGATQAGHLSEVCEVTRATRSETSSASEKVSELAEGNGHG
ncbi:hypothetical protein ATO13_04895 [Stappia sp. 22II-S9-Z10]|nr:hypothetical protein ATO13_04895 [Stappia sp. 22II-S9-Z10]